MITAHPRTVQRRKLFLRGQPQRCTQLDAAMRPHIFKMRTQFLQLSCRRPASAGHQRETRYPLVLVHLCLTQTFFFAHQSVFLHARVMMCRLGAPLQFSGQRPDLALMIEHMSNFREAYASVMRWAVSHNASKGASSNSHKASSAVSTCPSSIFSSSFCNFSIRIYS